MKTVPVLKPAREFGPKPELKWIPVAQMIVDPAYQRDTESERSRRLIETIAAEFKWMRLQPLVVTPRSFGCFAVLDGQHRRAAAVKCGIGALPCMVVPACSIAEEADSFVRLNAARVAVTPWQMFYSRLAAGDGEAGLVKAICDEAGVAICRYPKDVRTIAPNETMALEAIRRAVKANPRPRIVLALSAMVQAFAGRRGQLRSALIRGVCSFAGGGDAMPDKDRLARALSAHDAYDIEEAARAERRDTGESADVIIARVVGELYGAAP